MYKLTHPGNQLTQEHAGQRVVLEQRDTDMFYVGHPDFAGFLLEFGRQDNQVVEAFHGSDWYTNDRYKGPMSFENPAEWNAFAGHYRAHNPGTSNFRVVLRKGGLAMVLPSGQSQELVPLGDSTFRIGEDEGSAERIRFDTLIDGQALRANFSGCDYYRALSP